LIVSTLGALCPHPLLKLPDAGDFDGVEIVV
jgi:hypothetical protein